MNNKTNVGLINTHTKGHCRNNNIYVVTQKLAQGAFLYLVLNTGVVGRSAHTGLL